MLGHAALQVFENPGKTPRNPPAPLRGAGMRTPAFAIGLRQGFGRQEATARKKADKSLQIPTKADNAVGFAITPAFAKASAGEAG